MEVRLSTASPRSALQRHALKAALGAVALVALLGGVAVAARPPPVQIWVASKSEKVRESDVGPADAPVQIALTAAGRDCAGAQIALRSHTGLSKLRASAEPLQGPGAPLAVSLARVATIQLEKPSGPDGHAGAWPDALIPDRDALFGEKRRAFPIDVARDTAQAVFVEVCVNPGAQKGLYQGAVALSWEGGQARVPVEVAVRAFDLPATPSLATAFGFSGYSAAHGHGKPAEASPALTRLYDTMALRRGITLMGGTQDAPPIHRTKKGALELDWTAYDAEVAPFLDGTALPGGARWTSVELREPGKLDRQDRRAYRRAWVKHFRARGWLPRLFAYVHDEPAHEIFAQVEAHARELREDVPEVRRLVTTALSEELPSVDLWVPLVNCFSAAAVAEGSCPRSAGRSEYRKAEQKGATLWWYLSCASHGCGQDPATDAAYKGWPTYVIDAPATAARAMGTLAFVNDIAGELYYDVVWGYDPHDPWKETWGFGGNGDGTLYYPGTPARIGGQHDVPVESLRLVQIGRGLADHAALSLCAKLGDKELARREAAKVAAGPRQWDHDPRAYEGLRKRVYDRIDELLASRHAGRSARAP